MGGTYRFERILVHGLPSTGRYYCFDWYRDVPTDTAPNFDCSRGVGLFFYDIFWVFFTPVMVSVAKSFDAPVKVSSLGCYI
ncbi:hypothetical protein GW17_00012823 [Ensete ventricosum]|nr:hypothetical protein GW17_00012823 [Ensete ventricosum]